MRPQKDITATHKQQKALLDNFAFWKKHLKAKTAFKCAAGGNAACMF